MEADTRTANEQHTAALDEARRNFDTYRADNELKEGEIRVFILPDNLKALDFVCARESRRRRQNWSRSHVINHFIYNRFILGNCNGDLQSISDSDCRKMGISMKSRNSERGTRNTASPVAEPVEATAPNPEENRNKEQKIEL
jgi:hypothetical protein